MNNCIGLKPCYIRQMPWRNGPPAKHQRYSARTICYAELRICASLATHRDILPLGVAPPSYKQHIQLLNNHSNHSVPPGPQHILIQTSYLLHLVAVRTPLASPTHGRRHQVLRHAGATSKDQTMTYSPGVSQQTHTLATKQTPGHLSYLPGTIHCTHLANR